MIGIVILNWNRKEETLECLNSVSKISGPPHQIILVDNGSTECDPSLFQHHFPSIHLIRNKENLGFAEGNNRGIAYALELGAHYVMLLNNDTRVDPEILTAFLEAFTLHPDAGICGAKIYYYDDPTTLWYAGGEVDLKKGRCYHRGCTESDLEKQWETLQETGYACGCALMIKKEVIDQVGLMDPRFFLLWEEIDWCWRIRQAGFRCLFVPQAKVWHKISTSFEGGHKSPTWLYFYARNKLLFFKKHHPLFLSSWTPWEELLRTCLRAWSPRLSQQERALHQATLLGIIHYHRQKFGPKG